jgi:hypothetical protein
MLWRVSHRADPMAVHIADGHYSRQKPGTPQFVPPGRCLVLLAETDTGSALWVTTFPYAEYVHHAWAGAWGNSMFRNLGAGLSSELIRDAVSATRWRYGDPPALGLVTFVDAAKIASENPGYCYKCAGFRVAGKTQGGLIALQLLPADMPEAMPPIGAQIPLFEYEAVRR